MMDDLEMTRLCAEAMGVTVITVEQMNGVPQLWCRYLNGWNFFYRPLQSDEVGNAQAMALVKKFEIQTTWRPDLKQWVAIRYDEPFIPSIYAASLNRAIVECVATIQKNIRQQAEYSTAEKTQSR